MQTVITIGFDIAKSVFQVHGVDAGGQVVIRRQLKRRHVLAFFEKRPGCHQLRTCRPKGSALKEYSQPVIEYPARDVVGFLTIRQGPKLWVYR
jgi:hypothetical protein